MNPEEYNAKLTSLLFEASELARTAGPADHAVVLNIVLASFSTGGIRYKRFRDAIQVFADLEIELYMEGNK